MKAIVFQQDWSRYPDAIVHTSTTNKSFIEVAKVYKAMGVKNYYFPLALLDKDLEHVNPFDENLDPVIVGKIAEEYSSNPWYALREIARFPSKGGIHPVRFRANRGNISAMWCYLAHVTMCLIMIRQTGKSGFGEQNAEWHVDGGTTNSTIGLVTKDAGLRDKTIANIKQSRYLKPGYLKMKHGKDTDNNVRIDNHTLNNFLVTAIAQKSQMAAENTLRGFSTPTQWWDELPFISFLQRSLSAAAPALSRAIQDAKEAGNPYGVIFTTTAGDRNTRDGSFFYNEMLGGMPFSEYLYDCPNEKYLHDEVEARCTGIRRMVVGTYNHRQLGYSDEWLQETIKEIGGTPESINKDFFNRWGTGGSKSPHSLLVQKALQAGKQEPLWEERFDKQGYRHYVFRWYIPKEQRDYYMANNTVVCGIDTSKAVGRDSITMVGINPKTLETVFVFSINETNVIRFCQFVADIMEVFHKLVLIPENKSTGESLIDNLLLVLPARGINVCRRVFNTIIDEGGQNDKADDRELFRDALNGTLFGERLERLKSRFGYVTAGAGRFSRDALYVGTLSFATARACRQVKDIMLTDELLGLQTKNDRIDHQSGGHDDHVISWLLAVWWLKSGKNLNLYGITDQFADAFELDEDAMVSEEARQRRARQVELKKEFDDLIDQLRGERDTFKNKRIEARLRVLDMKLEGAKDYTSLDELLDSVRGAKISKRLNRPGRM